MKEYLRKISAVLLVFVLVFSFPSSAVGKTAKPAAPAEKKVVFKDPQLEKIVRGIINKESGDIYAKDVAAITSITAGDAEKYKCGRIRQLDGIESLASLTVLELPRNLIRDLRPLGKLTKLQTLDLSYNIVEDITDLKSLPELSKLNLSHNRIKDVTPLSTLSKLKTLYIDWNLIRDITALEKLDKLAIFHVSYNILSQVDVLKKMSTLLYVNLDGNPIADITPAKKIRNQGNKSYSTIEKEGKAAQAVLQKIITPQMADLEKEKAIYAYLLQNVEYYMGGVGLSYRTPGDLYHVTASDGLNATLVDGLALDGHYAQAMRVLGGLAGLDVLYVIGLRDKDLHIWNMVKINGQYTHVDIGSEDLRTWQNGSYEYFNNDSSEVLSRKDIWDLEYFPPADTGNSGNDYYENIKVNSEIPVTRDLLVWVEAGVGYNKGGCIYGNGYGGAAVYPANAAGISLSIRIPKEVPVDEGIVKRNIGYTLYEINGYGVVCDKAASDFEESAGSDGETTTKVGPTEKTMGVNETVYITLLKEGSWEISYQKAEKEAFFASYEFKPISLTLVYDGTVQISPADKPDKVETFDTYSVTNSNDIVLPPYSAVYLPPEYSNELLGPEYDVWGRWPLAVNHTGQTKIIKKGEVTRTLYTGYKKGTGIELVLIAYEGDFTDDVAYLNRREGMIMIRKQVVIPK